MVEVGLRDARYNMANLRVEEGGLAIDYWARLGISRDIFPDFVDGSLRAAGFEKPWDVHLLKNGSDGGPDWQAWRVVREECVRHGVNPANALVGLQHYLESEMVKQRYGIIFECNVS